jgi:pseudaminic acid synthase
MFKVNKRNISSNDPPYIIAELSANHNGDIKRAFEIIRSAKKNGAHAVKFQAYTPQSMTIKSDKSDFQIKRGAWAGSNLFDLYKKAGTPLEWQKELFSYSKELGITCFSTPFDEAGVELLYELDAPAFKVASFEMTDHGLLNKIGQTKKPVLMSTGLATLEEIEESISVLKYAGNKDLLIFHCISSYPAPIEQSHLSMIAMLRKRFNVEVGLSDHTLGTTAAITAVALGATAIEKHFTLCRADGGADSGFSLEPNELRQLVVETEKAWLSLGNENFERSLVEEDNIIFRRSLYFVQNLRKGDIISFESVKSIRPGYGIAPKYLSEIIGKTVSKNVTPGDRVAWDTINR